MSAGSVITGQALLYWIHSVLGVRPTVANLLSTVGNTVLVFVANRALVWPGLGRPRMRVEVAAFSALSVAGLAVSTVTVALAAATLGDGLWINAANLAGFGMVWIARFLVLDRMIYTDKLVSARERHDSDDR
ncbi:MAG: GtrA family protein [Acidimicrobiales bacterium]|nr:GtrA family protein [Acidimicrobiales bacterium]